MSAPGAPSRPVVLFVLGMGRSGTSALTRVVSLCGGTLPAGMMGADASNPRGYWEPRAALQLNEMFLYRHGSTYFDPTMRLQEEGTLEARENSALIAKIHTFLGTLPTAPLVVIKDLHISVMSGVWFEAARQAGFDIAAVIAVRHPEEVIASLANHMRASPELSSALWLKYNLLAERHTRGLRRVFVEYANFLDDWRREMQRISAALPIDLTASDEGPIEEFLAQDLRRQRYSGPVTERFGTDWNSKVYETLRAAARDDPWDESGLDDVFAAYRATEHGFRTAVDDFHGHFGNLPYRVSRRFLKPISEARAIAHRRRGTWA